MNKNKKKTTVEDYKSLTLHEHANRLIVEKFVFELPKHLKKDIVKRLTALGNEARVTDSFFDILSKYNALVDEKTSLDE